jgi:uncharacterized membrane protein
MEESEIKNKIIKEIEKSKKIIIDRYESGKITREEYRKLMIMSGNYWVDGG